MTPAGTAVTSPAQAAHEAHGRVLFAAGVYFHQPDWNTVSGVWERAWKAGADKAIAASGLRELATELLAEVERLLRYDETPEDEARIAKFRIRLEAAR